MIDPEEERIRLAEHYSQQLDGRLEMVATEAYELSDLAREVLKAELQKRGLTVELAEHPPVRMKKPPKPVDSAEEPIAPALSDADPTINEGESEDDIHDMVTVRQFRDLPEALLAKGSLESAGIKCAITDDNMVRMDWFISNAIGGIKLVVNGADAAEADKVLSQPIPEFLEVAGVGEYEQPRCPKCGSLDISFRESQPSAYLSMALSVPIPFHRQAWRCHSCNVEWEDDAETDVKESAT